MNKKWMSIWKMLKYRLVNIKPPCLHLGGRLLLYVATVIFVAASILDTMASIFSYFIEIMIDVLAAGTLSAACFYLIGDIKYGAQKARREINTNPLTSRMAADYSYRTVAFAVTGLILNLIFAIFNGVLGIVSHSAWFGTLSAYYLLLSVMRFTAVKYDRRASKMEQTKSLMLEEIKVYRNCGILFIIMTIALMGTVILLMHAKGGKHYPGVAIFAVAAYTFYKTIISVINVIRAGKLKSPLLMTIRDIGYIDACVSILSLQTAMFASFGQGEPEFEKMMNGLTGVVVCLMVLAMGIRCIGSSLHMKKHLSEEGNVCGPHTCSRG